MSDHLDTNAKKLEIMQSMNDIAIEHAYKAFKEALKRSEDKELSEFELAPRTTRISSTVALIRNSTKSTTFTALISIKNERSPRRVSTFENTIAKATTVALVKEQEILTKIESGTEDVLSDLSWRVICARFCRELDKEIKDAEDKGAKKGLKPYQVRLQAKPYRSIIINKLKDNKYLANKKITELQYADFAEAFKEKEIDDHRGKPTVQNLTHSIKLIFEFAQRKRIITANQIPNIPKITWLKGKETPVISQDDLVKIMTNFQSFYESSRPNFKVQESRRLLPFYVALTSSCGLRPGEEVQGVKWSHLHPGTMQTEYEEVEDGKVVKKIRDIHVYYADIKSGKLSNRTKDGGLKIVPHSREIVIYAEGAKAIEGLYFVKYGIRKTIAEIVAEGKDDSMFSGSNGRKIDFGDIFKQYINYLKNNISESYTQYSLRHEFINSELNKGRSKSDIAEQCGTSTKTIEGYYLRYKALNRVSRLLSVEDIEYFKEKTIEALELN